MLDKNKIALLWIIREHKNGISVYEMREELEAKTLELPIDLEMFRMPSYFNRNAEHHIDELLKLGLIKTQNGNEYHVRSRLVAAPLLHRMQELFDISLTNTLTRSENAVLQTPMFDKPEKKTDRFARIFVAMPFKDDLKPVYTDHIHKVADALGISCKRADDLFTTNAIIHDVWSSIYHAELLIVDCTGRNPNVFYELGIAHTLGRKTVLIAQSIDDIPADVRHLRFIIYQYTPRGMGKFESDLTETIKAVLNEKP